MSVIANSAPPLLAQQDRDVVVERLGLAVPSGKAATPTLKPPISLTSATQLVGVPQAALGGRRRTRPSGGSPRRARTLRTPAAAYDRRIAVRLVAGVAHVAGVAIGVSEVSLAIRPVTRTVVSRVLPPAP